MRKWQPIFLLIVASCGTYVGNPKKNDDSSGTKKFAPPELDYAPPAAIAAYDDSLDLNLTSSVGGQLSEPEETSSKNQLRLNYSILNQLKIIKKSNKIVRRITAVEKISSEGKTSRMINSGAFTVDYKTISADDFSSSMQVCYNGENLLYMRWNETGKREIYYSGNVTLSAKGAKEKIVSRVLSEATASGSKIKIESSGEIDDDFDAVKAFRSSFTSDIKNGEFLVSQSKAVTIDGTNYLPSRNLLSHFNKLSTGSLVFWERSCLPTHRAPVDGSAGWCKGTDVGSDGLYTTDEIRNQKARELIDLGAAVVPHTELKTIEFPVACGQDK